MDAGKAFAEITEAIYSAKKGKLKRVCLTCRFPRVVSINFPRVVHIISLAHLGEFVSKTLVQNEIYRFDVTLNDTISNG